MRGFHSLQQKELTDSTAVRYVRGAVVGVELEYIYTYPDPSRSVP